MFNQDISVSVAVTTYNSSAYVIETLESIKSQTWKNIELIISDDFSTDDTVEKCRKWVHSNKHFFIATNIITVQKNTGVSANCNRCIKAASSGWIKFIAGDDILLPDCIEENMKFAASNIEASIIFSQVLVYDATFLEDRFIKAVPDNYPINLMNSVLTAGNQYKLLLLSDRINYTPSYFFRKKILEEIGGYDEENTIVEDYPMWLRLTKAGIRLYYFHKPTVGYRQHPAALNNNNDKGLFKAMLLKSEPVRRKYVFPYLPWDIAGREKHILKVSKFFQFVGLNKKGFIYSRLYSIATIYFNPYRYIIFFKKKILKAGGKNIFYAN